MSEKLASNFELNVLKIGINTFNLVKGDRFKSNGKVFMYVPSTDENKGKGTRYRFQGRQDNISAVKYKKDVLRADNIKLIGEQHGFQIYEVQYAYKIEQEKLENLICLEVSMDNYGNHDWLFKTHELPVERETKENYFLTKSHPVTHHSQIPKTDLNNVRVRYNTHYVLCKMDKYNEMEIALFKAVEEHQLGKIQTGQDIVRKETENLNKFIDFKLKQGY